MGTDTSFTDVQSVSNKNETPAFIRRSFTIKSHQKDY